MVAVNQINNTNINFKSYRHEIFDKQGNVLNRGDTCMFRSDIDYNQLLKFLQNKYSKCSKVNVVAHACSDGEEVYSFLAKLIDTIGAEQSKKYLPIVAHDINNEHINLAKLGEYKIEKFEQKNIFYNLQKNYTKFFDSVGRDLFLEYIKVKEELKDKVIFKVGNILEDVKNINFKNTVLFARNFWKYMGDEDIDTLAKYLAKNMDTSSTLIIGDYDKVFSIDWLLKELGFIESEDVENVFYKIKDSEPLHEPKPKLSKKINKMLNSMINKLKAGK